MNPELEQALAYLKNGRTIVTASHRQARFIRKSWQQFQKQESWEQGECFAWSEWLEQLFDYTTLSLCLKQKKVPRVLSPFEQKWIWQQLLEKELKAKNESLQVNPLVQQQSLVSSLMQAWKLSVSWLIDVNSKKHSNFFNSTEETQIFKYLVNKFEKECQEKNWVSSDKLANFLIENVSSWKKLVEDQICFYGFDDWTPQQKELLKIANQSTPIEKDLETLASNISLSRENLKIGASKFAEWQQAASWARKLAEAEPNSEIAVVVPSLTTDREQVLQIFQDVFQPQLQLEPEAQVPVGFNLSAGEPMSQQAIIKSARMWLSLITGGLGAVWQSAIVDEFCLGAEDERWARADLKKNSSLKSNKFYSIEIYRNILMKGDIIPLQNWMTIVDFLKENKKKTKTSKVPSDWCHWVEIFLEKIGWPGPRALTSKTYQAKTQWLENLRTLSAMDNLCKKISYSKFLSLLDEQINSLSFQPETPSARVQVLGVFEAIGLGFDYLWLSGCQSNNFPAPINSNPWLPVELQKQLQLPGASSQREQALVQQLFSGFKRHCNEINFSYAVADDGAEQTPSFFIEHLLEKKKVSDNVFAEKIPEYWKNQTANAVKDMQTWTDVQGDALDSGNVRSGVGILKDQASCPFKAYANYRLNAGTENRDSIGVDALQRGNWVHETLEMIWLRLGSQKALLELNQEEVCCLVEDCVRETILKPSQLTLEQQSPLIKLEYERTIKLVLTWLKVDHERPLFKSVEVEQASEVSVGPLTFTVRADRIDNFSDGTKIVIDYKTGKVNCNSWFNKRITEPQLPLYGLLFAKKLSAIAFAQLNAEGCFLKGYGEDNLEIFGINDVAKKDVENWENLLLEWQLNLKNIAEEYASGIAIVEPQPNACDYCEFPHLCRRDAYIDSDILDENNFLLNDGESL